MEWGLNAAQVSRVRGLNESQPDGNGRVDALSNFCLPAALAQCSAQLTITNENRHKEKERGRERERGMELGHAGSIQTEQKKKENVSGVNWERPIKSGRRGSDGGEGKKEKHLSANCTVVNVRIGSWGGKKGEKTDFFFSWIKFWRLTTRRVLNFRWCIELMGYERYQSIVLLPLPVSFLLPLLGLIMGCQSQPTALPRSLAPTVHSGRKSDRYSQR